MRIGLLTLPLHANIGGVLQNYALINLLQQQKHDVCTIDYRIYKHEIYKAKLFCLIKKLGLKWIIPHLTKYSPKFVLLYNIRMFIDKNIPHTKFLVSTKELQKISNTFDTIIVGSDQVWRKIFIINSIDIFYLGFIQNNTTKRLSYAASIGTEISEYSDDEIKHINMLIEKFSAISVREESAINLIKNTFKWNCPAPSLVLDPTLLLDQNEYINLINKTCVRKREKPYLFYYLLDNNGSKLKITEKIGSYLQLEIFTSYNNKNITPSIEQWLSDILNANFVITDSYHGVIFSIIFKKQFAIILNKERGASRFKSLIKTFSLENRIIDENNINLLFKTSIDYDKIYKILTKEKELSLSFLINNINS